MSSEETSTKMEVEHIDDDEEEEDASSSSSSEEEEENEEEEEVKKEVFIPGTSLAEEDGTELEMDHSAYLVYHQASLGPPCLSFDVVIDDIENENRADNYPLTMYGVAGSQASKASSNSIILFKMTNLHSTSSSKKSGEDYDDSDEEEEETPPEKMPQLRISSIKHHGAINRIRYETLGSNPVAAVWSEKGSVSIWNLRLCLQKLEESPTADWYKDPGKDPLYKFAGHSAEGYALDWSPISKGILASGDTRSRIHIWRPDETGSTWNVDQRSLIGHRDSVEDIQWSPNEANVMASCSTDKSIRIWDVRARPDKACMLTVDKAHQSDVNVINWNRSEPFIVSGGDDGAIKVWDLRHIDKRTPVATFKHHTQPVTSVEWHPTDATVFASAGEDDQVVIWDLSVEKDDVVKDAKVADLPPQLLFIHQGLEDVKEIHWHKQIPGLMMATSHTGLDVFRTISV
ncbi:glutamate-rich WD repeat-containing protein 1 [Lepeophtheirus salmonis]|uniref:Glutamate-rich WD repeat-containing protein 1 n=1 Tax=Lepeophtheirus salmonis TaxID=72036 RepID=C1BSF7_LEPSM|nr:glutamate-rich WD repeat-containing protein 1-like [Lepeophtheirus salmonis]ACO11960.1 Glutamate-rich WD repeat-containing protein 1 [Lepeophtheirus salmonis]ADD24063.1 Glutamate-rich WD repeat-containing protein 1 [Lepeophtheirus salmonis]